MLKKLQWIKYLRNVNRIRYLVSGAGNETVQTIEVDLFAAGNVDFFFFSQLLVKWL